MTWTADKEEASDEIPRRRKYSKMLAQLVNRFGELGGFDAWLGIACYFKEDNGNVLIPPFKMFKTLISNISNILIFLNKDLQGQLMPKIKVQIEQRLKYISDKEIKDLDKEILTQFIQRCQALLIHYLPKEEVFLMTEMAELDIALRFLTCPYFEKRLKGINEIKDLTEKIDVYEQIARTGANYNHFVGKATRYISAKVFIEWVEKNKIFELILGDSLHVEIIKRTHEIIKFIAKYEKIPLSLLDLLWKSCEGKHEATLIGMYDLITEIADSLDKEGIDFLKNKIESIPDEEQNEMTLKLIKGFAINTLPKLSDIIDGKVDEANMQMESYNCVGCLWRLMLDESKVTSTLSEIALNSLAAIIKERTCHPLKKIFLYKCFEKIQQRDSVSQCIHLIHSILTNGYYQHKFDNEYSLTKILEDLDAKFDLLDLMINEFVDFYKLAGSNIKKSGQEITDEIRSKPWNGKYSYGINFSNRLIFLEYLITNQCYDMFFDVPKIEKLWDLVIMQPNFNFDKDYFFSWVSRKQELLRFPETALLFAKDDLPDFFEKIICNSKKLDFVTLSAEGFDCFSIFFNIVNEQEGKLKTIKSNKLQMLSLDYSGKETLWNMFLECKNEATLLKIVNLLCETNLRLSPMLEENKKQVMEEFTLKAVNLMKEGYAQKNENYITKSVLILMHFFDRFEGKNRLVQKKEDNNRYGHSIVISVIQKPDNISKNIVIGIYQTLGSLRKKIADAFGLEIHEYKLFTKGNLMDHEEDDTQILQLAFHGPFVIYQIASNKANEEFHPKEIIANNSENIDLLFKLLSEDIQGISFFYF